ncbi:MAG: STAS domain-containing protein [Armatimonadetes bacterium]|nr:STAS domain-containing protein [Armatimonadota bacterium]
MSAPEPARIELNAVSTIADVQALVERMRAVLATRGPVTVDGHLVRRVDTAVLQALAVLTREARRQGIELVWSPPSAPLREAARLLGLDATLGFPPEVA